MSQSTAALENGTAKTLGKLKSSYSAIQILAIIATTLSLVAVVAFGGSLMVEEELNVFLLIAVAWNLPFTILLWRRSSLAFYAGIVYLIPSIPSVLGLILLVMWCRTKPFFGKDRVTYKQVEVAHARKVAGDTYPDAVPA